MAKLGCNTIEIRNEEVTGSTSIPECDIIYADPARRDGCGRKVFLLEDCSPDIMQLLPRLREKAPVIVFKLSPMADISMLAKQFGGELKEIHVVSLSGEVKELVCLLDREHSGEAEIIVEELSCNDTMSFKASEEERCQAHMASSLQTGEHLIEPCSALLKSGAFKLISERFGFLKLDASTHLYKSQAKADPGLFKSFEVIEAIDFSSSSLKELKKRRIQADVTARNLPVSSDELRKRIAAVSGGNLHIFACPVNGRNMIFICRKEV